MTDRIGDASRSGGPARLFVPGRIEVLGKHTDYAGGRSLLAATARGFTVEARPADDPVITVVDTARGESAAIGTEPDRVPRGDPSWSIYPHTVVRRVARDFPGALGGCRIELSSDLPSAAGLSSSSALITAVFLALDAVFSISASERYRTGIGRPPDGGPTADPRDREALAAYLGAVERGSPFPGLDGVRGGEGEAGEEGVGTRGGSEDHVAMLCGRPDALVRYAFEPVRREGVVPMPEGHTFVVSASGVRAKKTGDARARYNRLSDRAARAAALWRSATGGDEPHLGAILEAPDGFARLREVIRESAPADEREALLRRVRHFAAESDVHVPAAAEALAAGELERFGEIVDRSQSLAERLLGNQVPETVHLARSARELGAYAASAFGAGFGGSVWALVPTAEAVVFLDDWHARYVKRFPERAPDTVFFTTPAAAPAHRR